MQTYEYKVIPAPGRGEKGRGAKTPVDRFALALATLMNSLGRDGWEYLRAETLPSEERKGFTGRTTVYHSILVFRRPLDASRVEHAPRQLLTASAPEGKAPPVLADAAVVAAPAAGKSGPGASVASGAALAAPALAAAESHGR